MFDPLLNANRVAQPATELDEWARREAKSATMAHDLLQSARTSASGQRTRQRGGASMRHAMLLTFGVVTALFIYWLL